MNDEIADCGHGLLNFRHCNNSMCWNSFMKCWAHGLYGEAHPEEKCTRERKK